MHGLCCIDLNMIKCILPYLNMKYNILWFQIVRTFIFCWFGPSHFYSSLTLCYSTNSSALFFFFFFFIFTTILNCCVVYSSDLYSSILSIFSPFLSSFIFFSFFISSYPLLHSPSHFFSILLFSSLFPILYSSPLFSSPLFSSSSLFLLLFPLGNDLPFMP